MYEPDYKAYEKCYQVVYSAGAERWGHSPDDEVLYKTLKSWVEENNLQGKTMIEYACGEGLVGLYCLNWAVSITAWTFLRLPLQNVKNYRKNIRRKLQ